VDLGHVATPEHAWDPPKPGDRPISEIWPRRGTRQNSMRRHQMAEPSRDGQNQPRGIYRLRLTSEEVRELGKYLSAIVARVRAAMTDDPGEPGSHSIKKLTIDLAGAPTAPGAQLVLLVRLLRRTLGNGVLVELSGVRSTILASLVAFGIPRDVAVIDSRGRRWTN
jgi:hypothetical protein